MDTHRDVLAPSPRGARDLLDGSAPSSSHAEWIPWRYLLIFLAGAAIVVVGMWYHLGSQREGIRGGWRAQIESIAGNRARLVDNWLNARRTDVEMLAAAPAVRALVSGAGRNDETLTSYLDHVAGAYGYASIVIFDTRGRLLARSSGGSDPDFGSGSVAGVVTRTRTFRMELSEDRLGRRVLTIAVPVLSEPGVASSGMLGVVALRMRPETGLFRLLTEETVPRTDETLLFRLDPRRPGYLSPLKDAPAGWAAMNRSLEALRQLANDAADGPGAFGEVTDYRAVPVLVAVRKLSPMGWGLAVKVDRDEVMADVHRTGQLTGAAGAFLLLALAGILISIWRQQQRTHLLSAQMEQERALSNLKGYAEKIVASVPSGLLLLSADLVILSVNPSFLESFRLRKEDVVGHPLGDVARAEPLLRRAREVLQSGVAQRDILFDLYLIPRQETRPVLITMTGIPMSGEEPARLLLIVQDLSEEERLQAARRASEERFRDLVQGLDAIVWEADAHTLRFSFVSQRAETILGYPVGRWLGAADFYVSRIHPDDRVRAMRTCREAIERGVDHELEYRALRSDGREVWLRDIVHVVPGPLGRPAQLRGVTVDLTERKSAEEALQETEDQLRQAQKMDAVGKLAGGIAHDFNNLLMVIRGEADLILRRLDAGSPLCQNAEGIREASDQAASLTRQLLAFSRKQVLAPAVIDLNIVVAGIQQMLRRLISETIHLETVTAPDLGLVKADPGQLEQMILNLAVNARDAMPDGGQLTIATSNLELDASTAQQRGVAPGEYVVLEVSDTGVGMDSETQTHLFEPFFTTKPQGKGTGLGLSTVYGIVKQSGGHIWLDSEPGKGATFRVFLPRVEETAEVFARGGSGQQEAGATVRDEAPAGELRLTGPRRETVLLVEDAKRVRQVVREILEMNGFEVLEARQGAEALRISARHQGPIHLMLTDVVMPEMSGRELAQRLMPLRPDMRVLYMSGYTDDAIVRHGVLDAGIAFIAKPFTPDGLAAKVRDVLDSPAGSPVDLAARLIKSQEEVGARLSGA
jgi:PAS domain S-box-containing protein